MNNNEYKIGIDARMYGPIAKGLGRYTQEIVDGIVKLDKDNEYVIFLRKENFDQFQSNNPKVKKVLAEIPWYTITEQSKFPSLIKKEKVDLMHFPHFNVPFFCPAKFVVTIHDLILTKFPSMRATTLSPLKYKFKNLGYKTIIKNALKKSQKIIAVSNFTKDDIVSQFNIKPEKIAVTYEGVSQFQISSPKDYNSTESPLGRGIKGDVFNKYKIKKPYLLYVGNAYPHKNLEWLISIFSELLRKKPDLSLIFVGGEDYFYKRLKERVLQNNSPFLKGGRGDFFMKEKIIFTGYVPDHELLILYQEAFFYIFPSLYEGFGLPPLEAMVQGCPVLSSNQGSLPEILQDAALYFNPCKKEEAIEQIQKYLVNSELRQDIINKGFKQAQKYNWHDCIEKTMEIYLNALK